MQRSCASSPLATGADGGGASGAGAGSLGFERTASTRRRTSTGWLLSRKPPSNAGETGLSGKGGMSSPSPGATQESPVRVSSTRGPWGVASTLSGERWKSPSRNPMSRRGSQNYPRNAGRGSHWTKIVTVFAATPSTETTTGTAPRPAMDEGT